MTTNRRSVRGKARKFRVRTPEEQTAFMERRGRTREQTDAMIIAGCEAFERGEKDPGPAMKEAARGFLTPAEFIRNYPEERPALADLTADRPRLAAPGWTPERQRAFLAKLAETGCVSMACDLVGLSRQSAYALRRREPNSVFGIAWDTAIQMARQTMLDEATERALAGREVPVWYHGEQVGTRIVHNDRLLMFLLARNPEPAHPVLKPKELMQLWTAMLDSVDQVLPPPLTPDRLAELVPPPEDAADADDPWGDG